jgi:hypothetical protein
MTSDGAGFSKTPQYYILLTLPILYFEVMHLYIRKYIIWITDVLRSSESHLLVNNGYIRAAQCHIVPTLFILLDNLTMFNTFRHLARNGRRTVIVDLDRRTAEFKSLRLLKHLLGENEANHKFSVSIVRKRQSSRPRNKPEILQYGTGYSNDITCLDGPW